MPLPHDWNPPPDWRLPEGWTSALPPVLPQIESVARPCRVGRLADAPTRSRFGGYPTVPPDFTWPHHNGRGLDYLGHVDHRDLRCPAIPDGVAQFFYDPRGGFGYKPEDAGFIRVLHRSQADLDAGRPLTADDLPVWTERRWFGLRQRVVGPTVYAETSVAFEDATSYPDPERGLIDFGVSESPNQAEEEYTEQLAAFGADRPVQIGGYPRPIQSDRMEVDAARCVGVGQPSDWRLLLEMRELGDMWFGDAGTLYWFILEADDAVGRLDRVWMVMQCY